MEDAAAGAAQLQCRRRAEGGHDLGHRPLVDAGVEVPDALVLVVAVLEDHPLDPVEVGRLAGVKGEQVGSTPQRRALDVGVGPQRPEIGQCVDRRHGPGLH
jgi:hypothetical protein